MELEWRQGRHMEDLIFAMEGESRARLHELDGVPREGYASVIDSLALLWREMQVEGPVEHVSSEGCLRAFLFMFERVRDYELTEATTMDDLALLYLTCLQSCKRSSSYVVGFIFKLGL